MKSAEIRDLVVEWMPKGRYAYMAGAGALIVGISLFAVQKLLPEDVATKGTVTRAQTVSKAVKPDTPPAPVLPPRVPKPETVRALYLNAWAAGSPRKFAKLVGIADRTEVNAFVVDVKEGGEISYESQLPLAKQAGATRQYIRNVRGMLDTLRAHNIYPIARIVVFKDPVLAQARPDLAVKARDGSVWLDNKGKAWVDSYNKAVWDYNIELAREAITLGFSEVQWDYVRFSDAPRSYLDRAVYPAAANRTKSDAIREFMLYSRTKLADLKAPVTADVFGLTVTTTGDMGIGQQWEKMANAVDVILPMVYPSHFIPGNYGLQSPNAAPYRTIRRSMEDAMRRSKLVTNAAVIRPWLQAFTLGPPRYTPAHVRAQIEAVYDVGLTEWVLWSPGSNYDESVFAPEGGAAPKFEIPGGRGAPKADPLKKKVAPDSINCDTIKT
jgi:hypothetical protein